MKGCSHRRHPCSGYTNRKGVLKVTSNQTSTEYWVIFTVDDTHFMFDLYQVSRIENQIRVEGKPYRTIYYREGKPVRYILGQGYEVMSKEDESEIIESVQKQK